MLFTAEKAVAGCKEGNANCSFTVTGYDLNFYYPDPELLRDNEVQYTIRNLSNNSIVVNKTAGTASQSQYLSTYYGIGYRSTYSLWPGTYELCAYNVTERYSFPQKSSYSSVRPDCGTYTLPSSSPSGGISAPIYYVMDYGVNIQTSPTSLNVGGSSTLTYYVNGLEIGDTCTKSGSWSGTITMTAGSFDYNGDRRYEFTSSTGILNTPGTYTYTLTCNRRDGRYTSVSDSTTVSVTGQTCSQSFGSRRFNACYYDYNSGYSPTLYDSKYILTSQSGLGNFSGLNYNWAGGNVGNSGKSDTVAAVFRGRYTFNGPYEFLLSSDDGARLDVGSLGTVINGWSNGTHNLRSNIYNLSGLQNLTLRYFENSGNASINLSWKGCTNLVYSSANSSLVGENGTSNPAEILAGQDYVLRCDYGTKLIDGRNVNTIYPYNAPGTCTFRQFQGTVAVFDCRNVSAGTYNVGCQVGSWTGSQAGANTCARTDANKFVLNVLGEETYPADCEGKYKLRVYDEDLYQKNPVGSLIDETAFQASNVINWQPSLAKANIQSINKKTLRYEVTGCFNVYTCTRYVGSACVAKTSREICTIIGSAVKSYNCPVPEIISFNPADVELESLDNNSPGVDAPAEQKPVDVSIKCTDGTLLDMNDPESGSDAGDVTWDYNDLRVCSTGFDIAQIGNQQRYNVTAGVTVIGTCEDVATATLAHFTYGSFDWGQLRGRLNVRIKGGASVAEEFVYSGDLLSDPPPGFEKLYLPELAE